MPTIYVRGIVVQYDLPPKRQGRFSIWWKYNSAIVLLGLSTGLLLLIVYVRFFR